MESMERVGPGPRPNAPSDTAASSSIAPRAARTVDSIIVCSSLGAPRYQASFGSVDALMLQRTIGNRALCTLFLDTFAERDATAPPFATRPELRGPSGAAPIAARRHESDAVDVAPSSRGVLQRTRADLEEAVTSRKVTLPTNSGRINKATVVQFLKDDTQDLGVRKRVLALWNNGYSTNANIYIQQSTLPSEFGGRGTKRTRPPLFPRSDTPTTSEGAPPTKRARGASYQSDGASAATRDPASRSKSKKRRGTKRRRRSSSTQTKRSPQKKRPRFSPDVTYPNKKPTDNPSSEAKTPLPGRVPQTGSYGFWNMERLGELPTNRRKQADYIAKRTRYLDYLARIVSTYMTTLFGLEEMGSGGQRFLNDLMKRDFMQEYLAHKGTSSETDEDTDEEEEEGELDTLAENMSRKEIGFAEEFWNNYIKADLADDEHDNDWVETSPSAIGEEAKEEGEAREPQDQGEEENEEEEDEDEDDQIRQRLTSNPRLFEEEYGYLIGPEFHAGRYSEFYPLVYQKAVIIGEPEMFITDSDGKVTPWEQGKRREFSTKNQIPRGPVFFKMKMRAGPYNFRQRFNKETGNLIPLKKSEIIEFYIGLVHTSPSILVRDVHNILKATESLLGEGMPVLVGGDWYIQKGQSMKGGALKELCERLTSGFRLRKMVPVGPTNYKKGKRGQAADHPIYDSESVHLLNMTRVPEMNTISFEPSYIDTGGEDVAENVKMDVGSDHTPVIAWFNLVDPPEFVLEVERDPFRSRTTPVLGPEAIGLTQDRGYNAGDVMVDTEYAEMPSSSPTTGSSTLWPTEPNPVLNIFLTQLASDWEQPASSSSDNMIVGDGPGVMLGTAKSTAARKALPASGEIPLLPSLKFSKNGGASARCFVYAVVMGLTGCTEKEADPVVQEIVESTRVTGWIATDSENAKLVIAAVDKKFGVSIQVIEVQKSSDSNGAWISGRSHDLGNDERRAIVIRNTGNHYDAIV